MRLIVGLGNPGPEYAWTPHNLGFLVVDRLAEEGNIRFERPEAKSYVGLGQLAGQDVVLAKPQTMMNLSGLAVRELACRYECEPADWTVIFDDVALPWGMLRIRERGSAGGHNGLKSLIGALGSNEFPRLRIGIGEAPPGGAVDFVLTRFRPVERKAIEAAYERGADCVEEWCRAGTPAAMNRYNAVSSKEQEGS